MNVPLPPSGPPSDTQLPSEAFRVARKSTPHDSGAKHVQGAATYIDDIREPLGTLHVAPGYAKSAAKGHITRIDLEAVKTYPGVVCVLTAADIPGLNDCSPSIGGDPVFASGEILFHGQVVFAVVAETRDAARRATRLAVIEVEAVKPAVEVEDAVARDTVVLPDYEFIKGEPSSALDSAPAKLSGSIRIGGQEHFYLEGQAALAMPMEDGDLLIHTSTQHPTEVQHITAKVLGLPDAAIVAECRRMGGGFGGKESQATQWAVIAALAARVTGRPAKLRLDRDDDMIMTGKRHDFRVDWSLGHDGAGRVQAIDVTFLARCGYSADLSLGVNDRTMFHADNSYELPNARIYSRRMLTDTVSNTAFRGFGGPQGMVFIEHAMDALAISLGEDPLDVRKANFYPKTGGTTPYGMPVDDNILHELVADLEATSHYRARRADIDAFNAASRILKKGIALTPLKFGISFTLPHLNQAGALVHVYSDGSIMVNHGGTEMGQGLYLKVAQVVAEEFGVSLDRIKITATTTAKVPNTSPTAASSGSDLNGMAARNAAAAIRTRMAGIAAEKFGVAVDDVMFRDNRVWGANQSMSFDELAKTAYLSRIHLSEAGYYATPGITWDRAQKTGRPFFYFAYGAACSEVIVDTLTGEMKVTRVDILHDVGHSLNPAIDIGQIEGGFVQGMGWLTTEELVYDIDGRLRTHAPSTYKIPTASDVPEHFTTRLFESGGNRAETIYRSKAVGEPPVMLAISVFSAITHAIASLRPGIVPPLHAPATPEAIMRAVRAMRG
jgi:xanthine dehydrogenase large subunit